LKSLPRALALTSQLKVWNWFGPNLKGEEEFKEGTQEGNNNN